MASQNLPDEMFQAIKKIFEHKMNKLEKHPTNRDLPNHADTKRRRGCGIALHGKTKGNDKSDEKKKDYYEHEHEHEKVQLIFRQWPVHHQIHST